MMTTTTRNATPIIKETMTLLNTALSYSPTTSSVSTCSTAEINLPQVPVSPRTTLCGSLVQPRPLVCKPSPSSLSKHTSQNTSRLGIQSNEEQVEVSPVLLQTAKQTKPRPNQECHDISTLPEPSALTASSQIVGKPACIVADTTSVSQDEMIQLSTRLQVLLGTLLDDSEMPNERIGTGVSATSLNTEASNPNVKASACEHSTAFATKLTEDSNKSPQASKAGQLFVDSSSNYNIRQQPSLSQSTGISQSEVPTFFANTAQNAQLVPCPPINLRCAEALTLNSQNPVPQRLDTDAAQRQTALQSSAPWEYFVRRLCSLTARNPPDASISSSKTDEHFGTPSSPANSESINLNDFLYGLASLAASIPLSALERLGHALVGQESHLAWGDFRTVTPNVCKESSTVCHDQHLCQEIAKGFHEETSRLFTRYNRENFGQYMFDAKLYSTQATASSGLPRRFATEYSCSYPGVSWNTRMQSWLVYFEDAEGRKSRTFNPKRLSPIQLEALPLSIRAKVATNPVEVSMHCACTYAARVRWEERLRKSLCSKLRRSPYSFSRVRGASRRHRLANVPVPGNESCAPSGCQTRLSAATWYPVNETSHTTSQPTQEMNLVFPTSLEAVQSQPCIGKQDRSVSPPSLAPPSQSPPSLSPPSLSPPSLSPPSLPQTASPLSSPAPSEKLLLSVSEAIQRAAAEAHVSEHLKATLHAQVLSTVVHVGESPRILDTLVNNRKPQRCVGTKNKRPLASISAVKSGKIGDKANISHLNGVDNSMAAPPPKRYCMRLRYSSRVPKEESLSQEQLEEPEPSSASSSRNSRDCFSSRSRKRPSRVEKSSCTRPKRGRIPVSC